MTTSTTLRRNRLIAFVAAIAMIVVICGYTRHDSVADAAGHSCHCDWTVHFTGVAGSAPDPVPIVKPALAGWRLPPVAQAALTGTRRVRAHLARAPPPQLSIA
jgi:hypothetical protein